jgi:hypothetical protein
MKVRELLKHLDKLAPELAVLCYTEEERFLAEGRDFIPFDISDVSTAKAERLRLGDGTPYLKFDKRPRSAAMAILEVTSDF